MLLLSHAVAGEKYMVRVMHEYPWLADITRVCFILFDL
jgi:hypothetical protein